MKNERLSPLQKRVLLYRKSVSKAVLCCCNLINLKLGEKGLIKGLSKVTGATEFALSLNQKYRLKYNFWLHQKILAVSEKGHRFDVILSCWQRAKNLQPFEEIFKPFCCCYAIAYYHFL